MATMMSHKFFMCGCEAAAVLMEMARGGGSRQEVEALQLGVRSLVKRYFDQMKNRAVRQARRLGAELIGEGCSEERNA